MTNGNRSDSIITVTQVTLNIGAYCVAGYWRWELQAYAVASRSTISFTTSMPIVIGG